MIETLSVELIMSKIVADSRESSSVKTSITEKTQAEREWLLWVTGVISDGEKGEIRRTYKLRSSIVHDSDTVGGFLHQVQVPRDIDRAMSAIDTLHEELHGIELKHRFSKLIT